MQMLNGSNRSTAQEAGSHRRTVMLVLTEELYPEEKFPKKNFPNVHPLLMEHFTDAIKDDKKLWNHYSSGKDTESFKQIVRETLDFPVLLQKSPQVVVLMYQKYIGRFISFKHNRQDELDDILQEVITRLIEDKIYKIRDKYDFNFKKISTFTSYLMVTVRNIYIDIMRERKVRPLTGGEVQELEEVPDLTGEKMIINRLLLRDELAKLKTILVMYYKTRPRLELCLKLKYRLPVSSFDVKSCFPQCTEDDVGTLTQDFKRIRDKRLFEHILTVFNQHEGRDNKSDTLRKWVNVKVDEIISHLNRTHGHNAYNSKNFADFVSFYFDDHLPGDNGPLRCKEG